ncbi:hypothetical protein CVM52_11580 [Pseudooceanicola lipolyticus]|uniref:DUF192 domain-containing protein n=1 Tax=Pseudooceanicola lipolyticus TaxID=2029104 RepID=A0A2M8J176_9RHOB|nr:DUF192 domain-containing protein [Pseudooceanicola lipolyticus]PJE36525.1 hypothetical protein CVM52_11580 [Pseudooceanicola lipolyticus]
MRSFLTAAVLLGFVAPAWADCAPDRVELRGDWGSLQFSVELADTPEERAQGLMFRESMARGAGMLFIYEQPQHATFWMKNTLIPLDMIFVDAQGTVTRVHDNAVPGDLSTIDGGQGVLAVLEINGGLADRYGIGPGTQLRHPAFGTEAAWPCED